jgi:hypothetical protein
VAAVVLAWVAALVVSLAASVAGGAVSARWYVRAGVPERRTVPVGVKPVRVRTAREAALSTLARARREVSA